MEMGVYIYLVVLYINKHMYVYSMYLFLGKLYNILILENKMNLIHTFVYEFMYIMYIYSPF